MAGPLKNPRHEEFAQRVAKGETQRAAYIAVGYKDGGATDHSASALVRNPTVASRIEELLERAARRAEYDIAEALRTQLAIARADPRELIGLRIGACRYCHGVGHLFQWKEREFLEATAKAEQDGSPLPEIAGGFGYRRAADPHPDCPECDGEGVERVVPRDTSKLSPEALLLYEGVKVTRDGLEIKIADRKAALDRANKIIGAYIDRKELSGPDGGAINLILTPDDASL